MRNAASVPYSSTCTEWSMTRSTGWSGLMRCGSPPSCASASRIAARSTTAGTPVKSCSSTRAVRKAISFSAFALHVPVRHRFDVGALHERAVFVPEQILEEDLEAEGEPVAVALRRPGSARRAGRSCTTCPRRRASRGCRTNRVRSLRVVSRCRRGPRPGDGGERSHWRRLGLGQADCNLIVKLPRTRYGVRDLATRRLHGRLPEVGSTGGTRAKPALRLAMPTHSGVSALGPVLRTSVVTSVQSSPPLHPHAASLSRTRPIPLPIAEWLMSIDSTSGAEERLMHAFADALAARGWAVTRIPVTGAARRRARDGGRRART